MAEEGIIIRGRARLGRRTKELVRRLQSGDIAVIDHADLDEVAAEALLKAGVGAVVNTRPFISGRFPHHGPDPLLAAGITLLEEVDPGIFDRVEDGNELAVDHLGHIVCTGKLIARGVFFDLQEAERRRRRAEQYLDEALTRFVENTLDYAQREKESLLGPVSLPEVPLDLKSKQVVVVVRGPGFRQDLEAIAPYLEDARPVVIAVDGGADALREIGHRPDLVVGDMDSVSDEALRDCPHLVVHAYPDGKAPGMARLEQLGLAARAKVAPLTGTSEDLAMLLAAQEGASLIVLVGGHSNLVDFLEKGRPGMASTFLVRLKVGPRLVDARGISEIYARRRERRRDIALVAGAALFPALVLFALSPFWTSLARLVRIWFIWRLGV